MELLRDVSNPQSLDAGALFVRALKSETYLSWPLYLFKFKCCREHKEDGDGWGAIQKCVSHPPEGGSVRQVPDEGRATRCMAAGGCGSDSINTELTLLLWNSMWGHQKKTWHFYQSHSFSLHGVGVKDFRDGRLHGHPSMKWPASFNYLLQNRKASLPQTDFLSFRSIMSSCGVWFFLIVRLCGRFMSQFCISLHVFWTHLASCRRLLLSLC